MPGVETRRHRRNLPLRVGCGEANNGYARPVPCDFLHCVIRTESANARNGFARSGTVHGGDGIPPEPGRIMAGEAVALIVPAGQDLLANVLNSNIYGRIGI